MNMFKNPEKQSLNETLDILSELTSIATAAVSNLYARASYSDPEAIREAVKSSVSQQVAEHVTIATRQPEVAAPVEQPITTQAETMPVPTYAYNNPEALPTEAAAPAPQSAIEIARAAAAQHSVLSADTKGTLYELDENMRDAA